MLPGHSMVAKDPGLQQPPEALPSSSSSSSSPFPLSSLPTALRISISGEEMGAESASSQEPAAEQQEGEEGELEIPEDMPMDLRAKLALAMINLGKGSPEVLLIRYNCNQNR